MASNMEYEGEGDRRYDDEPRYGSRDRSRSPRPAKDDSYDRQRSASPNGRVASRDPPERSEPREGQASNTGSNLFVTGISPRLTEDEVTRMFEKFGQVESCSIMKDPHTQESRGFGFVKMATSEGADAAKDGLHGENFEGRSLSIEKARRNRPRTPTPGRYFGPPKREDFRRGGGGGGRYDDRRGYGGDRYRDDYYSRDRYDDRGRGYGRRDDYRGGDRGDRGDRGGDRYQSRRDDYDRRDDRRGGGGGGSGGAGGSGYEDRYSGGGGGGGGRGGSSYERSSGRDANYSDDRYDRR